MLADLLRLLALSLTLGAVASFPAAVLKQRRPRSAWFSVVGCELFMLATAFSVTERFGAPIRWYRTPLCLAGALLVLTFVWLVMKEESN